MNFSDMTFLRKFSMNLHKNLNVPMAKMTFTSDFTKTERGDLYPKIASLGNISERVTPSGYTTSGDGYVERLMCAFFPFSTYKMNITSLEGSAGFAFVMGDTRAEVSIESDDWETAVVINHKSGEIRAHIPSEIGEGFALIVTVRPGFFDVYVSCDGVIQFVVTADVPSFAKSNLDSFYMKAKVHTKLLGNAFIQGAESYIDCGIGQADIRPFRYENGDIIMENGRIFLSISSRLATGSHQSVLSWLPGTADFKMEGAIFYSNNDGAIHGEVAASYVYNRMDKKWHVWVRNGAAGHVLSYASFDYDIRFGVNILDVNPLPLMTEENLDDKTLLGKKGDEDPDFVYDEVSGKWLFALCRLDEETKKYRYFFFESDRPDSGYKCIGYGPNGEETGGSIVKLDGKFRFVCGNSFKPHSSEYRVYNWGEFDSFTTLKCDYPDGGFRGWGTVMPVRYGSRIRYFWLTFDRTLMSKVHNWSYGNLYCFEAEGVFR